MRRILCCLLLFIFICTVACAEADVNVRLTFEDGFSLSLPADWVCYEVSPTDATYGILYCLGSADGLQLMYIQRWAGDYPNLAALQADAEAMDGLQLNLNSESTDDKGFLVYSLPSQNASGCMTLFGNGVLNLLFKPYTDKNYMLVASQIMESYQIVSTSE